MTTGKCLEVLRVYKNALHTCEDWKALPPGVRDHLNSMFDRMEPMILNDDREKFMRWLGYAQGVLHVYSVYTLDELKNHNRPPETLLP